MIVQWSILKMVAESKDLTEDELNRTNEVPFLLPETDSGRLKINLNRNKGHAVTDSAGCFSSSSLIMIITPFIVLCFA